MPLIFPFLYNEKAGFTCTASSSNTSYFVLVLKEIFVLFLFLQEIINRIEGCMATVIWLRTIYIIGNLLPPLHEVLLRIINNGYSVC